MQMKSFRIQPVGSFFLFTFIVALIWCATFLLFITLGHSIITSAYNGEFPIKFVNEIIEGQHLNSLEIYLESATGQFMAISTKLLKYYLVISLLITCLAWYRQSNKDSQAKVSKALLIVIVYLTIFSFADQIIRWIIQSPVNEMNVNNHQYIRLRHWLPNINTTLTPDINDIRYTHLVNRPYKLRTDENGFIMPSRKHDDPDINIFFLGGSTTETIHVLEENRFPYVVGNLIENKTGLNVNSFNAGKSGNSSLHSLNILVNKILPQKPEMVLLMHNVNDLVVLLYRGSYWNNSVTRSNIVNVQTIEGDTASSLIDRFFRFLVPYMHNRAKLLINGKPAIDEHADIRGTTFKYDKDYMLSEFENMLRTFIAICRANNIVPVLMTQQSRYTKDDGPVVRSIIKEMEEFGVSYDEFITLYSTFNDQIRTVASNEDILLVDLDREIPKTTEYIYDTCHLNDKGSLLASRIIADTLISSNIFTVRDHEIYGKSMTN